MERPTVVLPQPDSPTMPSTSPSASDRDTPSTAWTRIFRPVALHVEASAEVAHLKDRRSAHIGLPSVTGKAAQRLVALGDDGARQRIRPADIACIAGNAARRRSRTECRPGAAPGRQWSRRRWAPLAPERACTPSARACRGEPGRRTACSTAAVSTIRPAYMTATRSASCAIDAQVVGDEQHRHVEPVAQLAQQAEDLELDRDVERRRRLVGDQHVRPAGERDGDHHPLAHARRRAGADRRAAAARRRECAPCRVARAPASRRAAPDRPSCTRTASAI